jgi:hypothetical protein
MGKATDQITGSKVITDERGEVYGDPSADFDRAARIEAVVSKCPDPRMRHILYMLATKMARLTHSPYHVDSWADIAGYARTAGMVIDADGSGSAGEDSLPYGTAKPNFGPAHDSQPKPRQPHTPEIPAFLRDKKTS